MKIKFRFEMFVVCHVVQSYVAFPSSCLTKKGKKSQIIFFHFFLRFFWHYLKPTGNKLCLLVIVFSSEKFPKNENNSLESDVRTKAQRYTFFSGFYYVQILVHTHKHEKKTTYKQKQTKEAKTLCTTANGWMRKNRSDQSKYAHNKNIEVNWATGKKSITLHKYLNDFSEANTD